MKKELIAIGSVVVAAILVSIPIMASCAFCLDWGKSAKFIFTMCSVIELLLLAIYIFISNGGEE